MAIGNHDFDDSIEGLVPFSQNVPFPLLAANIDPASPRFGELSPYYQNSTVVNVKGHQVTCHDARLTVP